MSERTDEYANLALDSYTTSFEGNEIRRGGRNYIVQNTVMDPVTGFYGVAYRSLDSGRTIIAYRGTDDLMDGTVDLTMATSRLNLQQLESEMFTRSVIANARREAEKTGRVADVTVTGHSLGGGLAEANAARFGLHGETFNSYGATGLIRGTSEGGRQVINHVRAGDPISAANRHFGEMRIYATPEDITTLRHAGYENGVGNSASMMRAMSLSAHSMTNFVPAEGQTTVIGPESEARYRANREMIDHFRSDILCAREVVTHISTSQSTVGPALAIHSGQLYAQQVKNDLHELAERSAPAAQAAARGAVEAAHALNTGAHRLGDSAITGARALDIVPDAAATAVWGSRTGSPDLDRMLHPPKLTDADHPGHALYEQALRGVHAIDAATGRRPDHMSENLAAALTVEARRHGLGRIDHVTMSEDFSRAYAVQGGLGSPFKQFAEVPTEIGIATSVDRSSAEWRSLEQPSLTRQDVPGIPMSQTAQTESPFPNHGSSLSR